MLKVQISIKKAMEYFWVNLSKTDMQILQILKEANKDDVL